MGKNLNIYFKVTSSILYLKVTYDEETEEWNICRTSTLFYQIIKLRSVDFKFKLDTEFMPKKVLTSNLITKLDLIHTSKQVI